MEYKYLKHIPTQCCYPLEPDGKTIIICGAKLTPVVDGKIFWEYANEYTEKVPEPADMFSRTV